MKPNPSLSNRESMPRCAESVDLFRKLFGDGIKVTWASENGIEKGRKGPEGVTPILSYRKKAKADAAGKVREPLEIRSAAKAFSLDLDSPQTVPSSEALESEGL